MNNSIMQALEERLLDIELGLLETSEGLQHFKHRIRVLFLKALDEKAV